MLWLNLVRPCPAHRRCLLYVHNYHTGPSRGDKVAMSGGVDSSVTAKLLADPSNEYDLSAVFMRNWDARDESGSDDGCEWKKDWEDVQRVCRMLDIPVKMDTMLARPGTQVIVSLDRVPMLRKPLDSTKDQTYYLSSISENSLSRALFPLSQLTKAQVRNLAIEWKLPTATRDESMGLCFVGERKRFSEFISQYIVPKPGPIVDMTTGKKAGVHQGLWNYTIGQGAKMSGMPQRMFVAKKDPRANVIFVVPGADHPALYVEGIRVRNFHWIWADDEPPEVRPSGLKAHIKYRHCMTDVPCTVHRWVLCTSLFKFGSLTACRDTYGLHIIFHTPQKGIAPGQIATIYAEDWCLGCGVIDEVIRT
ncbi:tRNA-specific 2-thiouridylase [Boletus reticuloceps]|uniref:tRNA-5-taurinomethyluridine 2-sulfurtransferase n=1 Tax=Boletus reticuloceps TaxID=495285 RepID=A0A8I2YTE5_9AGAM|nr:tRNA-specific 2-thiouridylase [Boletus reticuloceps]